MPDRIDFKQLAETIDILDVAAFAGLRIKGDRAACPACNRGDDRAIELLPETNSFRCHVADAPPGKKVLAGDCIALYAHVQGYTGMYRAAKELQEHFGGTRRTPPATTPQKEKGGTNLPINPSKEQFDPAAFADKLEYTADVEALGLTEEQAKALGIGVHRGRVYCAMRYGSGTVAGFLHVAGGKIVLPKNLLPDVDPKIVRFPKRA
jgi:hypothetical protein